MDEVIPQLPPGTSHAQMRTLADVIEQEKPKAVKGVRLIPGHDYTVILFSEAPEVEQPSTEDARPPELPDWAQRYAVLKFWANRNMAIRCAIFSAKTEQAKRQVLLDAKRLARE